MLQRRSSIQHNSLWPLWILYTVERWQATMARMVLARMVLALSSNTIANRTNAQLQLPNGIGQLAILFVQLAIGYDIGFDGFYGNLS